MDQRLRNTTAIVTGGGRGIGAAAARAMAQAGARIGLIARSEHEVEAVAQELRDAGGRACAAVADVRDLDALQTAVAAIEEELGPTDVLVCSAGVSGGSSAYACSKASLLRLAEVLAADLEGTGVVSISMSPGLVLTRMTEEMKKHLDLPEQAWSNIGRSAELMVRLAAGDGDPLAGTMVHAEDDLDALLAHAGEIRERGWYALRMVRGLEGPDPV